MQSFSKFNPFEAATTKATTADPRAAATPTYQQQPMRGVDTPDLQTANSNATAESAVDVMEEVWDTDLSKSANQHKIQQLKDEDFGKLAASFNPVISDEEMAAAMKDPAKFKEMMASVAKQALSASTNLSAQISNNYLEQAAKHAETSTNAQLTKNAVMSEIKTLNNSLTTVKPFREMTEQMVAKYLAKNPNADAKAAASQINDYVATKLGLKKTEESPSDSSANSEKTDETDWTKFLE